MAPGFSSLRPEVGEKLPSTSGGIRQNSRNSGRVHLVHLVHFLLLSLGLLPHVRFRRSNCIVVCVVWPLLSRNSWPFKVNTQKSRKTWATKDLYMIYFSHAKLMFTCSQIPPGANMRSKGVQAYYLHSLWGFSQVRSVTSHGSATVLVSDLQRVWKIWKRCRVAAKLIKQSEIKHLWSPLISTSKREPWDFLAVCRRGSGLLLQPCSRGSALLFFLIQSMWKYVIMIYYEIINIH